MPSKLVTDLGMYFVPQFVLVSGCGLHAAGWTLVSVVLAGLPSTSLQCTTDGTSIRKSRAYLARPGFNTNMYLGQYPLCLPLAHALC